MMKGSSSPGSGVRFAAGSVLAAAVVALLLASASVRFAWGQESPSRGLNPPAEGFRARQSDPKAIGIADRVMEAMGGREAWDDTRHLSWVFFGKRRHFWDKWTGDVRIEAEDQLVLMNIHTREGRVFEGGVEVTDPVHRAELLEQGYAWWVNDSYWVFMPYKLKDTGVRLGYLGEGTMTDGREAEIIELTFEDVGLTPQNRYVVMVDAKSHLVGEWAYFENAADETPQFTTPWGSWQKVGRILLAGDRGRGLDWKLAVYDELPASVYESPQPVSLD